MAQNKESICRVPLWVSQRIEDNSTHPLRVGFDLHQAVLYSKIKQFLLESEDLYPDIGRWWHTRALPGIKTGERSCKAVLVNNELAGLSIIKHSKKSAKLCTLKVHSNYRHSGIGQYLLQSVLADVLYRRCNRVHYTISEEIMSQCGEFFSPYGFGLSTWRRGYYIKGRDELIFSLDTENLRKKMSDKSKYNNLFLSFKKENTKIIEESKIQWEVRRESPLLLTSARALLNLTPVVSTIRLPVGINRLTRSSPALLCGTGNAIGDVGRKQRYKYLLNIEEGNALTASQVQPPSQHVALVDLNPEALISEYSQNHPGD